MKKPELLAPAGNIEKLKMAVLYGADAVYFAGKHFGLRAASDNFDLEHIREAIQYLHNNNCKGYLTVNIIPHNEDLAELPEYIKKTYEMGIDAYILSDPGVFRIVKEVAPNSEIHISTQANNTNYKSAQFWENLGAKRIVLARELSFREIKKIKDELHKDTELEAFVHGAMCISYSGRCLLSNYMIHRDANRGECAHPCRWKYYLVEEKRPGEYMPVQEDEKGTYIFNSKDLCMIEHIPQIVESGITSLKIEGRVKSAYYVATVVKAYRTAIDSYIEDPVNYKFDKRLTDELEKVSHRQYTTGFYFNKPDQDTQIYNTSSYIRKYNVVGIVKGYEKENKNIIVEQRNRFFIGDNLEFIPPKGDYFDYTVDSMLNKNNEHIDSAPHPQMIVKLPSEKEIEKNTLIRKEKK